MAGGEIVLAFVRSFAIYIVVVLSKSLFMCMCV